MPARYLPWTVALGLFWIVGGLHVDGWAHFHGHTHGTPFTIWHALFYSGLVFTGCALASVWLAGRRAGLDWRNALPRGYRLCFLACIVFAFGGVADIGWHLAFGVENTFAALISPTHLVLYTSICCIAGAALSASWLSGRRHATWADIFVATMLLSMLSFWGVFDNLLTNRYALGHSPDFNISSNPTLLEELGVLSIVYQSAVQMGMLLTMIRRFRLPRGTFTFMLGLSGAMLLSVQSPGTLLVVIPLLTGVVADVLYWKLRPALARPLQLRVFAFLVPTTVYASYFALERGRSGLWWPVHVWFGSIFLAGAVGLLISLLVLPNSAPLVRDPFAEEPVVERGGAEHVKDPLGGVTVT